jgi:hypothetical protein
MSSLRRIISSRANLGFVHALIAPRRYQTNPVPFPDTCVGQAGSLRPIANRPARLQVEAALTFAASQSLEPCLSDSKVGREVRTSHPSTKLVVLGCRTISRFLYPCGRQSFIWADHYWPALATYPGVHRSGPLLLPYLVLLHVGFALPVELLPLRCALTAPFHPYRINSVRRYIFCCTFRIRFRIPAVSRHAALWRPDFPPPFPGATTRPAAVTRLLSHLPRALCISGYWN